jgi:hypothetical protein
MHLNQPPSIRDGCLVMVEIDETATLRSADTQKKRRTLWERVKLALDFKADFKTAGSDG